MNLFRRQAFTSPTQSIVKAVTWRIIGELDTFLVSYFLTGSMKLSISIIGIESLTKTALYYLHERAWGHMVIGLPQTLHKIENPASGN